MFIRLHSHQTINLINDCSILIPFKEWLHYVQALYYDKEWQALALVTLFRSKLDIKSYLDLKMALEAVEQCKSSPFEPCTPD